MWRQHQICAVALLALGLGLIIGCACGVTVVSILLGVVVLHESFAGWQMFGAALILTGVYVANLGGSREVFR